MPDDTKKSLQEIERALMGLPAKARNALLFDVLQALGVESVVMPGENGTVEGLVADRVVALKYFKNRVWSPAIVGVATAALAKGGSYIDLGANIGLTAIPVARDTPASCIAIEPNPDNFALLGRNLARNGLAERVTTIEAAVVAEAGPVTMEIAPENLGDHRVRFAGTPTEGTYGEGARPTIQVSGAPLDALVDAAELQPPVVVKMDIQGAEPLALASGPKVMAAADLLLMEYWPYGLKRLAGGIGEFLDALEALFPVGAMLDEETPLPDVRPRPFAEIRAALQAFADRNSIEATDVALAKSPERLAFG